MSGFEVAGVILGAIPIIISALQQYKTTRQKVSYFGRKALYIDRLIDSLEEQKVLIEADLCILLRAVGFETANFDSYSQVFQSDEFEQELYEYLGSIYDPYRKALLRCENSLRGIAVRITGYTSSSSVNPSDLKELAKINSKVSGKLELGKRIKFSINKEELDELIKELNESSAMLSRLRTSSTAVHDESNQSTSPTIKKLSTFLNRVRKHVVSLHAALSQSWKSGCHPQHNVCLYLDGHSAPLQKKSVPIQFKLALPDPASATKQILLQETQVEVMEDDILETLSSLSSLTINTIQRPKVRIEISSPTKPAKKLSCICSSIDEGRRTKQSLKLFLSIHDSLLYAHVPPASCHRPPKSINDYISLESILKESPDLKSLPKRWTLHQRMVLAFKLASSLLQYRSTPWLGDSWSKKAVFFQRIQCNISGTVTLFEVDHPFITHTFMPQASAIADHKPNAKRSLLELGILLLEIFHEETFEDYTSVTKLPLDGTYGRQYDAARNWLDLSAGEAPPLFWDAAALCIECPFNRKSTLPDWDDAEFQKSVCEGVIKPLWENCPRKSR